MRRIITTKDKELFSKFNALHFTDEVLVKKKKNNSVSKIINNINKKQKFIEHSSIGDNILLKRLKPFNFSMYLRK